MCYNPIEVNFNEKIPCENLILAIGHSARDTFKMLYDSGIKMSPKPFAVGIRIMHPRIMIDEDQYGKNSKLSSASYKLTYQTKDIGSLYDISVSVHEKTSDGGGASLDGEGLFDGSVSKNILVN